MVRPLRCLASFALFFSLILPAVFVHAAVGDFDDLELEGRWARGTALGVAASDGLVYAGVGARLEIVDFTDAAAPVLLSAFDLPSPIYDVFKLGRYVYVADFESGLYIFDVLTPEYASEVGSLLLVDEAWSVHVVGGTAYVADNGGGVRIIDVSVPSNPTELGFYDIDCYAVDVRAVGNRLYVADQYDEALKILDITNPAAPVLLGSRSIGAPPWGVEVEGSIVYVVDDYTGLTAVDVSDPANPGEAGKGWLDDLGYDIQLRGDHVFIANDWEGLAVVDKTALPSFTQIGFCDTPGYAFRLALDGDRAYMADQHGGIRAMDISTLGAPVEIGSWANIGWTRRVVVRERYAYMTHDPNGLIILDTSALGGPAEVGRVDLPGSPWNLDVEGDYAYVACQSSGGVRIVDISDPTAPFVAYSFFTPDYPLGEGAVSLDVEGDLLFVVDYYYGVYVYDVTDPTAPVQIEDWGAISYPNDVAVQGDYVYMVDRGAFRIWDATDPTTLTQIYYVHPGHWFYDVDADGDRLYLSRGWRGVDILDISTPASPSWIGMYDSPGTAQQVDGAGDLLYVADGSRIRVVDVSIPATPTEVGYYNTGGNAIGVAHRGQRVYLADYFDGLYVFKDLNAPAVGIGDDPPQLLRLDQNRPNPFNPRTVIEYSTPAQGWVRLSIYDTAGRRVRVLIDESQPGGPHLESWDGRDDRGRALPSGVYRYRLEAAGEQVSKGMVLVR